MLKPGTVVKVPVQFKQGDLKYLVIAALDSEAHCFVINSNIHALFGREPFRSSYVSITVATHPFMHHDSYIDCNEIKLLSLIEIRAEINADASCLKGELSQELRAEVVVAIQNTPCLTQDEKDRYARELGSD